MNISIPNIKTMQSRTHVKVQSPQDSLSLCLLLIPSVDRRSLQVNRDSNMTHWTLWNSASTSLEVLSDTLSIENVVALGDDSILGDIVADSTDNVVFGFLDVFRVLGSKDKIGAGRGSRAFSEDTFSEAVVKTEDSLASHLPHSSDQGENTRVLWEAKTSYFSGISHHHSRPLLLTVQYRPLLHVS